MPTDQQIAIMCDIGGPGELHSDKKRDLDILIAHGFVARDEETYRLTAKGQQFLAERGAGLNES